MDAMPRSIESFVDEIATALEREKLLGEVPVVRRKVRSVVYKCGSKRRTQPFLDSIEAGLAEAGVFVDPDITDIDLGLDTYVRFTLEPPLPVGRIFKPERALAYHLSKWPSSLEQAFPELGRLKHHHGGSKPERSYWLEGMELKPDLVFSSGSGSWLVCELERATPRTKASTNSSTTFELWRCQNGKRLAP